VHHFAIAFSNPADFFETRDLSVPLEFLRRRLDDQSKGCDLELYRGGRDAEIPGGDACCRVAGF
jgi:hypothetical protein